METEQNLKISQINVYPVKSCAPLSPSVLDVLETGFEHDREWMVVDENNNFVTQRQYPKLALIKAVPKAGDIHLEAPNMPSIDVPILEQGRKINTEVWGNPCIAIDQGELVSKWLSDFVGKKFYLVRMAPDFKRGVKSKYQSERKEVVGFADAFPFLLISEESLNDLNSRLIEKVPMNRFRPNIVVSGGRAFQEDTWKKIKIGDIIFRVVKPCDRCEVTTVDQSTGEKGIEPLETLGKYRTRPKGIMFGQNLLHEGLGTIRVGDVVEILE